MSAPEHVQEQDGLGSRVKLTMNAKLQTQPELSVREGTTEEELDRIIKLALSRWEQLVKGSAAA